MTTTHNRHGLPCTTNDPDAVVFFDDTVRKYLAFGSDIGDTLKQALARDPEMPMARLLRGYFLMLMGVRGLHEKAQREVAAVDGRASDITERERMHLAALRVWTGGSLAGAASLWDQIANDHPRDILAVKMAHFGHFYQGDSRGIRDGVARVLDAWSERDDVYSYLLSMYAFGLEESGQYAEAEAAGRDAIQREPRDPWGIHAVAHVLEATERPQEGIAWIEATAPHWTSANNFRYHVAWHQALFQFERGDYAGALASYDRHVFAESATEYLDICNDASLLLRLELAGADVGTRWRAVAVKAEGRVDERVMPFIDVHFVLALASSTDPAHRDLARHMASAMTAYGRADEPDDARPYRAAGASVATAILDFRAGRYAEAANILGAAEPALHAIGGSHAQRDLFHELAAECIRRSDAGGRAAVARFSARSRARPRDRLNWARYLESLDARGELAMSMAARTRRDQALS